jgi:hypothetical protein
VTTPRNPMQPLILQNCIVRFKRNAIVRHLLDEGGIDLNDLAAMEFSQTDREQFAQLIGYSVTGYHELSEISDESALEASAEARKLLPDAGGCRDTNCPIHCGVERNET